MNISETFEFAKGMDNVKFIHSPAFIHHWLDNEGKVQTLSELVFTRKFKPNELIEYLIDEKRKGNTVYIVDEHSPTMYDPIHFEAFNSIRLKSVFGKTISQNLFDNNKFRYLLIR